MREEVKTSGREKIFGDFKKRRINEEVENYRVKHPISLDDPVKLFSLLARRELLKSFSLKHSLR